MKRKTTRDNIEYTELCKIIRKNTRKDPREANTKRVKDAIETGRGMKKCTTEGKKALSKQWKRKMEEKQQTGNDEFSRDVLNSIKNCTKTLHKTF